MNIPFKIYEGTFSNLQSLPLKEGAVYFCKDTKQIFADLIINDELTRIDFGSGSGSNIQITEWEADD